jgi:hypothetical protein
MTPARVADPFYYLANFEAMLETVSRRDGDLLVPEERQFIADFGALPPTARALLVRMAMRKGVLFRAGRLVYPEIGDLDQALGCHIARGWIDDEPSVTLEDLCRLFGKPCLVRLLGLPKRHLRETNAALLAGLRGGFPERQPLRAWGSPPERIYELRVRGLCQRLQLMFFGNFTQDLGEFVLADLGVFKYEPVRLQPDSRPFHNRRQVDDFHQLHHCRELLHAGVDAAVVELALPAPISDREWLEERRQKLRFRIGREYERTGRRDRAAALYGSCPYPEARRRADRMGAASGRRRAPAPPCVPSFELTLDCTTDGAPVERRVLDHLQRGAQEPTQVAFVENALVNSLFGLLCWPAVFAPVPGAFFHPFHHGPADLGSPNFHARRRTEFDACLALLDGGYREAMLERFSASRGTVSPFVAWGLIDEALLRTALVCFPPEHLRHWFDWMLADLRTHRSGFPDLVQFYPESGRYRLIEVKAPGDRLQDNQRSCLEFMASQGMPVSVCRVRWAPCEGQRP